MSRYATRKLIIGAVSVGAVVLGGAGVSAVAAPGGGGDDQLTASVETTEADLGDVEDAVDAEVEAPEAEAPDADEPEAEAPETEAPEVEGPDDDADEPEAEAPEAEAPETEAPEVEAPEGAAAEPAPAGPSENASVVAQQAWAAAHAPAEARSPGSVSEVVLQYVPAGHTEPQNVPQGGQGHGKNGR